MNSSVGWLSSALGVGSSCDEDAVAAVRGAEGGSRKAIPLRVVPERGQASDHLAKEIAWSSSFWSHSKEVCEVLHEHESGSKLANDSEHLAPKSGLWVIEAGEGS